jgi:hypothetical protein
MTHRNSHQSRENSRWYDKDPALKEAMCLLENATQKQQAQVALNIIKIILEHQAESNTFCHVEDLMQHLQQGRKPASYRRWYDANETLCSAIDMLHDCPDEFHPVVIPAIYNLVAETIDN